MGKVCTKCGVTYEYVLAEAFFPLAWFPTFTHCAEGVEHNFIEESAPVGPEGPSARKRTVAAFTQCPGPGGGDREPLIRAGIEGLRVPTGFVLHAKSSPR